MKISHERSFSGRVLKNFGLASYHTVASRARLPVLKCTVSVNREFLSLQLD